LGVVMSTDGANKFDRLFLRRLAKIIAISHKGRILTKELGVTLLLLAVSIGNQVVVFQVGKMASFFYKTLVDRDEDGFYSILLQVIGWICAEAILLSVITGLGRILSVMWRENITRYLHDLYLHDKLHYYRLLLFQPLDNPDQRITEDVKKYCGVLSELCSKTIVVPGVIIYYSIKTWILVGWVGPVLIYGYFLIGLTLNKFIMDTISVWMFRQEKLEGDFRFAHQHIRTNSEAVAFYRGQEREKSHLNSSLDKALVNQRGLIFREFILDVTSYFISYFGAYLNYIVIAIPIFHGAYNSKDSGELAEIISFSSFVCLSVIGGFSDFFRLSVQISNLCGFTGRVGEIIEKLHKISREIKEDDSKSGKKGNVKQTQNNNKIKLENVSSTTPNGLPAFKDVNLEISNRRSVLITGPSGCGKTSILRVLNELWPCTGTIEKPDPANNRKELLFLPQLPYFPLGTLRDQIIYPHNSSSDQSQSSQHITSYIGWDVNNNIDSDIEPDSGGSTCNNTNNQHTHNTNTRTQNLRQHKDKEKNSEEFEEFELEEFDSTDDKTLQLMEEGKVSEEFRLLEKEEDLQGNDEELQQILKECKCEHLFERYGLDTVVNWEDVLSPGEQQRISMCRLLYHHPSFALLDESTSHLDEKTEEYFYWLLKEKHMTVISVGHRNSLRFYHDTILEYDPDSQSWIFEPQPK